MKDISPLAWRNINLNGRYEFLKPTDPLNLDAIVRELTELIPDTGIALAA
jgi:hypothetical protein